MKIAIFRASEIEINFAEEVSSFTGSVLLKNFIESAYASLMKVMYSLPNSSIIVSPIPVALK